MGQVRFIHPFVRFYRSDGDGSALKDVTVIVFGPDVVPGSVGPLVKRRADDAVETPAEASATHNFYPTPTYVTCSLIDREKFDGLIWEPACGDGAMSNVLQKAGHEVHSSDIVDRGYGEVGDFLKSNRSVPNIVTNPPFNLAEKFVQKALANTTRKVAMFLPLSFLTSKRRYDWLPHTPLKYVYIFTNRVSLYPSGERGNLSSGTTDYAWFVWEHGYEGEPTIRWFSPDAPDAEEQQHDMAATPLITL